MKKILAFILVAVMLATALVACAKGDENNEVTTEQPTDSVTESEVTGPVEEKPFDATEMKEKNEASDKVMNVLCWNSEHSEFEVEYGNNTVDNAIYKSNKSVEERLNIKLSYEKTLGDVKHTGEYKAKVTNAFNGGEYWDVIASYTRSTAICAAGGLLKNLGALGEENYLDFEKPWWSQDIMDKTSVGNAFISARAISPPILFK